MLVLRKIILCYNSNPPYKNIISIFLIDNKLLKIVGVQIRLPSTFVTAVVNCVTRYQRLEILSPLRGMSNQIINKLASN